MRNFWVTWAQRGLLIIGWVLQIFVEWVRRNWPIVVANIAATFESFVAWVRLNLPILIATIGVKFRRFVAWVRYNLSWLSTTISANFWLFVAWVRYNLSWLSTTISAKLVLFIEWVKRNIPILVAQINAKFNYVWGWLKHHVPILRAKIASNLELILHWVHHKVLTIGLVKKPRWPRMVNLPRFVVITGGHYGLPTTKYHFSLHFMRMFMLETIKNKMRLAFIGVAGLFALMGWLAVSQMSTINEETTEIAKNWLPSVVATNAMNTATSDLRIAEALHVLSTTDAEMTKYEGDIELLAKQIADWRAGYEPLISSPEEKAKYVDFSREYDLYMAASKQVVALSRQNKNAEASSALKQNTAVYDRMSGYLVALVNINNKGAGDSSLTASSVYLEGKKIIIIASILVSMMAVFLMWYFEKTISRPLEQITGAIQQLAKGDVGVAQLFQDRKDEIGQTAKSVGNITQTLKLLTGDSLEVIGAIQAGTLSVRADTTKHPGEFGEILKGMNKLLEVLNKPLSEISDVMQKFALGNLKTNMQGAYEGDLRALKANVNRSLDALVSLFGELGDISTRMATGDLTKTVTGSYQGDFATLKNNMNNVITQLAASLKTIVANAASISTGVNETNKTSLQVAEQSSQQMSAIVEMANAVAETSASIRMIAENAKRGNDLAGSTAQLADTGLQQLNKLVEVIEQISTEYSRIEQITGKITRIADKTHLLSLNAGLEAVRAGEHGLGFGFVAQQIGKLAEEASIAARDIGNLITGSMQSVRISVTGSRETRAAMQQISSAAQESGVAVQAISIALGQQSTAVEWISEKVRKVQSSSEANAVSAKEISQTMAHLTKTVEQTNTQVQRFTLA